MFPVGVETRRVDADGRFKIQWTLCGEVLLSEVLGWESGALDVVMVAGWMMLTQPADCVGVKPKRNGCKARFTAGATAERVNLKPAHLIQLGLGRHRVVLVAPVPEHGALVVANPESCLSAVPGHVAAVLGGQMAAAANRDPDVGPAQPHLTLIKGATQ